MTMNASDMIDGFLKADTQNQIARRASELQRLASESRRPTCGRCHYWMMSSQCPQERNVKGISRGPNSASKMATSCPKFGMSRRAKEQTRKLECDALQASKANTFAELPE